MPPSRVGLQCFLNTARSALANASHHTSPVTFVIGNESADLDSLCSAVLLAYLRTYTSTSKPYTLYIPLSNIPRADLSLRPELIPVLSHANLKPSDLITLSDLPPTSQSFSRLSPDRTRWMLVDHNALQGELGSIYGSRLVGCIDHHDEENKVPTECPDEMRVVKKSGSCSSLVVEYCKEAWSSLSTNSSTAESKQWDAEVASLALGPILIDTTNLTSKLTPADTESAEYLERLIKAQSPTFKVEEYFKEVSKAKEDIGGLSIADILRKDYKQWDAADSVMLGVSSVVQNMDFLLEKAEDKQSFFDAIKHHAKERDLSACAIMTTSHKDNIFRRELFLWGMNEKGIKACKKFEEESKRKLQLEEWGDGALDVVEDGIWRRCWHQKEIESSRKQVAPLLRTAIEQAA